MRKAIVLLSGGLDSTTCMGVAVHEGYEVYPISFHYNQRHSTELESARAVAEYFGVPADRHLIVDLGRTIRGSSLTGDAEVPLGRPVEDMGSDIPSTYVPSRNIIFLAHAASRAEAVGAEAIYIGVNALDYSGYPDCRPEFVAAFQQVLNVGTKPGVEGRPVRIETPLLNLTKAEVVKLGVRVGAPLQHSYTCYSGTRPSCGVCDACLLRLKGFREAGVEDPIPYVK
ncbi:MAG TPA: 7-cyano-7-deazaguanine synthase QueC [Symbiobacteriaceae bacterium]|nr:7-cyano-7-deazaguanine synthase QueC [Symbiobacteriaceae bacterium]